jgi:hypothetical protein
LGSNDCSRHGNGCGCVVASAWSQDGPDAFEGDAGIRRDGVCIGIGDKINRIVPRTVSCSGTNVGNSPVHLYLRTDESRGGALNIRHGKIEVRRLALDELERAHVGVVAVDVGGAGLRGDETVVVARQSVEVSKRVVRYGAVGCVDGG